MKIRFSMRRPVLVFVSLLLSVHAYSTENLSDRLDKCKDIAEKAQRLECFDQVAGTPDHGQPAEPSRFEINPKMVPTCYIAKHGPPACSPTHDCDPSETGIKDIPKDATACYVMGATPNCCTYCPPEWSGNC